MCLFLVTISGNLWAQKQKGPLNFDRFSKRNYYFGLNISYYHSFYHLTYDKSLLLNDTVQVIDALSGSGFSLGIIANLKLGDDFDLRFIPSVVLADHQKIDYRTVQGHPMQQKIAVTLMEFPLQFRYKSKVYHDIRVFATLGGKYSVNMMANSNSKANQANDLLKTRMHDFSVEAAVGFQVFFPYFILSPELKFSHGLLNLHDRDPNLLSSSSIDKIFSRSLMISISIEG